MLKQLLSRYYQWAHTPSLKASSYSVTSPKSLTPAALTRFNQITILSKLKLIEKNFNLGTSGKSISSVR